MAYKWLESASLNELLSAKGHAGILIVSVGCWLAIQATHVGR